MIRGDYLHIDQAEECVTLLVLQFIVSPNAEIDNRKSLCFNHSIQADKNRKLKLTINNSVCKN